MYTGPHIITDGLVLHLDSMNSKSYPGTGTIWYDLSGNNNHGTLVNMNPSYTGNTSGFDTVTNYMMFDRHVGAADGVANNYINIINSDSLDDCIPVSGMTISMWVKMTSYTCTALTRWNGSWEIYYCANLTWRSWNGATTTDGVSSLSNATYLNKFHQIVATHNGSYRKFYINGVEIYSNENSITNQNTTNSISIGAYSNGQYAFIGALPQYSLYNRALYPSEILQNFNSTKSRYL